MKILSLLSGPYSTLATAILKERGNHLTGWYMGRDVERVERIAEKLNIGLVGVNLEPPTHYKIPSLVLQAADIAVSLGYDALCLGINYTKITKDISTNNQLHLRHLIAPLILFTPIYEYSKGTIEGELLGRENSLHIAQ